MSSKKANISAESVDLDDECLHDIINISYIDFHDEERWLTQTSEPNSQSSVLDIRKWLESSSTYLGGGAESLNTSKRLIDTRTWTRSKKRFSRLSFDSILEVTSPSATDPWRIGDQISPIKHENPLETTFETPIDSVPAMLRPATGYFGVQTGQESLEAFINLSEANGVDSFINMEAPDFNDPASRSALFSSSSSMNQSLGMADSQILTESMMQTSMLSDISDINLNDPFSRDLANDSVIENPNFCADGTELHEKTFNFSLTAVNDEKKNLTFTSDNVDAFETHVNNQTFDRDISDQLNRRSYIIIKDPEPVATAINDQVEINMNVTYETIHSNSHESLNSLEKPLNVIDEGGNSDERLNSTYSANENDFPSLEENLVMEKLPNLQPKVLNSLIKSPLATNNQQNPSEITTGGLLQGQKKFGLPPSSSTIHRRLTFKKSSSESKENPNLDETYDQNFVAPHQVLPSNRFHTFRKNGPSQVNFGGRVIDSQAKSLDNLLATKMPAPAVPRQINPPNRLSRLPQSLQKSNPNLPSVQRKAVPTSTFGFSGPKYGGKNGAPTLASKLYSLSKVRNDSINGMSNYTETGGSTESIDSTQSTHSAPDLDDRLSACSDSSHNSFCQRTIDPRVKATNENSKTDRRILENTWINDDESLPSPIMKESVTLGSRGSSPGSGDSIVKTSSPLLSPSESLQTLNINGGRVMSVKSCDNRDKKIEDLNKASKPLENKSGLRPPAARGLSGIPRPASRIPGPRITQTGGKNNFELKRNAV